MRQRQPGQRRRERERGVDPGLHRRAPRRCAGPPKIAEPVDAAEHGERLPPLRGRDRLGDVGVPRERPDRGADPGQEPQQRPSPGNWSLQTSASVLTATSPEPAIMAGRIPTRPSTAPAGTSVTRVPMAVALVASPTSP